MKRDLKKSRYSQKRQIFDPEVIEALIEVHRHLVVLKEAIERTHSGEAATVERMRAEFHSFAKAFIQKTFRAIRSVA